MKKETQICFIIDFVFVLSVAAILYLIFAAVKLTEPFIFAFLLALIFIKLSENMQRCFPLKSKWAVIASALFFYALVTAFIWLIMTETAKDISLLSRKFPDILELLSKELSESSFLSQYTYGEKREESLFSESINSMLYDSLKDIIDRLSKVILDKTALFFKKLPVFFSGFLFTILSSFYISTDYYNIKSFAKRAIPKEFHFFFTKIRDFFKNCLLKILKAYIILMIVTFFELSLGFYFLGIDDHLKIAAITALLDILPLLGTGCVLIPWALFEFIRERSNLGWGLSFLYLAVTVVRNILEPHLIGKELGLSPLLSLIACFWGLKLMGLKGMLLFPTGFLALKFIFSKKDAL